MKNKHIKETKDLSQTMTMNKRKSISKCHVCNIKFRNISKLKWHMQLTHKMEGDNKYNKTDIQYIRNVHVSTKNNNFQCPFCPQSLTREYALKIHIKARHKSRENFEHKCPFCSYKAPLGYYLQMHIASKHSETEYARLQKTHICETCGYRTARKSHFLKHKLIHLQEKPYKCSHCDYSTITNCNLKVHLRIHTKEKPYNCNREGCDYKSSSKSALQSHEKKHNKDKFTIYCDKCSYKTLYNQCLKRHYERHLKNNIQDV